MLGESVGVIMGPRIKLPLFLAIMRSFLLVSIDSNDGYMPHITYHMSPDSPKSSCSLLFKTLLAAVTHA